MANSVFSRRPAVGVVTVRLMAMTPYAQLLGPASMLRFGQMCQAVWVYLDITRQNDVTQPVDDQSRLAGIEAAVRRLAIECKRYYLNASGPLDLKLTQDASAAIDQMLAYDVITTATFDVEKTVLRILSGAKVV